MKKEAGLIIGTLIISVACYELASKVLSVASEPGSVEAYFIGWFAVIYWCGLIIIFVSGWSMYCNEVSKQNERINNQLREK